MVQFVNIREFKAHTEDVLRKLQRSDVVLTIRGKPKAVLHKVSEDDLSLEAPYTDGELDKLEQLAKEPGAVYKTASAAKRHLRRLTR